MMSAPYRGTSPAIDDGSEARELQDFARKMHASRRVWGNEHFGQAILRMLMGSADAALGIVLFCCATSAKSDRLGALIVVAPGLAYLALGIHSLVAWRRATRSAR